ncbi:MAG: hypothetical protein Q7J98_02090 [Kiritimatiellia bacterium]|nr:hypothetical protein [Kiritimatiellia bacterium]
MEDEIDNLAKIIWDYHHINHQVKKADCILILGSHDPRVAEQGIDHAIFRANEFNHQFGLHFP